MIQFKNFNDPTIIKFLGIMELQSFKLHEWILPKQTNKSFCLFFLIKKKLNHKHHII